MAKPWTTPGIPGDVYKQQHLVELAEILGLPDSARPALSRELENAAGFNVPLIQQSDGPGPSAQRKALEKMAACANRMLVGIGELDEKSRAALLLEYRGYIPAYELAKRERRVVEGKELTRRRTMPHARTPQGRLKADTDHLQRMRNSFLAAAASLPKTGGRPSTEVVANLAIDLAGVFVGVHGTAFIVSKIPGKDIGSRFVRRALEIACPEVPAATIQTAINRAAKYRKEVELRSE